MSRRSSTAFKVQVQKINTYGMLIRHLESVASRETQPAKLLAIATIRQNLCDLLRLCVQQQAQVRRLP